MDSVLVAHGIKGYVLIVHIPGRIKFMLRSCKQDIVDKIARYVRIIPGGSCLFL